MTEAALAGMARDFDKQVLKTEFGENFHVRYRTVFEKQKDALVAVEGQALRRVQYVGGQR